MNLGFSSLKLIRLNMLVLFKGVVDDASERSVGPARSLALQKADVILVAGARLNWMLHFGRPPRFDSKVKIIHVSTTNKLHYILITAHLRIIWLLKKC